MLGPTVLNILGLPIFTGRDWTGASLEAMIRDLSEIGVLLLMFVAGLETDLAEMRRVGKVAFWSAFGGVVLPLVAGAATASAFGFPLYWDRHLHRHHPHRDERQHLGANAARDRRTAFT